MVAKSNPDLEFIKRKLILYVEDLFCLFHLSCTFIASAHHLYCRVMQKLQYTIELSITK